MKETETPRPDFTRRLDALDADDLPVAGGKGASLGAMLGAGLPVPEGFAVLTDAYRAFVRHNGFAEAARALAEGAAPDDPQVLEAAADALKGRFVAGEIPPEVAAAIETAYAAGIDWWR